jgi:hypothetical protein
MALSERAVRRATGAVVLALLGTCSCQGKQEAPPSGASGAPEQSATEGPEGNAGALNERDGGTVGAALCGRAAEPCCPAPLPACALELTCDAELGRCVPALTSSEGSRLCRDNADCPAGNTCCAGGRYGTCTALADQAECSLPDLAVRIDGQPELSTSELSAGDCSRSCVRGPGQRRLLGFGLSVFNLGGADVILGGRGSPGVTECTENSEVVYVDGLLSFELEGENGTWTGDGRLGPGCGTLSALFSTARHYSCDLLGLERNAYEMSNLGCPFVDISGAPPGKYTLRVRLNTDGPLAIPDKNLANNSLEIPVVLPFPLDPCVEGAIVEQGIRRECGWQQALIETCTPGEQVVVGCGGCDGDLQMRICAGSAPCLADTLIAWAGFDPLFSAAPSRVCPGAAFECPQNGSYSVLVSSYDAAAASSCTPRRVSYPDPLVPCAAAPFVLYAGLERECGWQPALSGPCTPGELVNLSCGACEGEVMLRACEQGTSCTRASNKALPLAYDDCQVWELQCPETGSFSSFVASYDESQPFSCDVVRL